MIELFKAAYKEWKESSIKEKLEHIGGALMMAFIFYTLYVAMWIFY